MLISSVAVWLRSKPVLRSDLFSPSPSARGYFSIQLRRARPHLENAP